MKAIAREFLEGDYRVERPANFNTEDTMKRSKAIKRLERRIESYDATSRDSRIDSRGRKRPGSMQGRK